MLFRSLFQSTGSKQAAQQQTCSIHRTVDCKRFAHPEFQIQVANDAIPAQDISWLLRFLEQRVADGERFRVGETLQIGWMLTMLDAGAADTLRITEPDMKEIPIKFIDSVNNTLMHLRNQKDVVESVAMDLQPDFPLLRQSAVVHAGYKSACRVLLTRDPAHETDSGWSLTDLNDEDGSQNPAQFIRISLYQLGVDRPDLIKFFALPPGLQVAVNDPQIHVIGPEGEMQPIPGSYLEALNNRRLQRHSG
ncbi:immunity protein Imm33 domain-containing protein [Paraburkholderia ferrariae]|uniref:Imm33-like domain-containing protein n=1 Tax=Paraburkholderia ferrariae TaxID=386056 RepID=A0ABU9S3H8_9BURK